MHMAKIRSKSRRKGKVAHFLRTRPNASYSYIAWVLDEDVDYVRNVASQENLLRRRSKKPQPQSAAMPDNAIMYTTFADYEHNGSSAYDDIAYNFFGDDPVASVNGKARNYRHPVSGEKFPSVTTILGVLDKPGINFFRMNLIAQAAIETPYNPAVETPEEALKRFKYAQFSAVKKGTAIHKAISEETPLHEIPEQQRQMVAAARDCMNKMGWVPVASEIKAWGDGYAGSADMIIMDNDGHFGIVDWKTTSKNSTKLWNDSAMQVAAYARTNLMAYEGYAYDVTNRIDYAMIVCISPSGAWEAGKVDVSSESDAVKSFEAVRSLHAQKKMWDESSFYVDRATGCTSVSH